MQEDNLKKGVCNVQITTSEDELEAYISIGRPDKDEAVQTVDSLLELANDAGIVHGIKKEVLQNALAQQEYNKIIKFAVGTPAVNGTDGWYEFFFETNIDTSPKILKDGSVDYSEYGDLPTVEQGDRLAKYHPAKPSVDGVNVRGGAVLAKKGKDLAKIKGKGFVIDETNTIYTAKYDGKVTYRDERLIVDKELVVEGDVSNTTGDIDFQNDIHIRGNVLTGVTVISQKGSIIVDGYVEQAQLSAKGNIVLKNGMQGNGKGTIEAGGSVKGKFFERVRIKCKGDVNANAIMNADIESGQDIIVSGKYGIIIGGMVSATRYISANIIGNMSEVRTIIKGGVDGDLFAMLSQCERTKEECDKELKKASETLEKMQILIEKTGRNDLLQQKMVVMRRKIELDTQSNELMKRQQEIVEEMGKANLSKVTIAKVVYPGTVISINGVKVIVDEENHHVEYSRRGSGIIVYNIGE